MARQFRPWKRRTHEHYPMLPTSAVIANLIYSGSAGQRWATRTKLASGSTAAEYAVGDFEIAGFYGFSGFVPFLSREHWCYFYYCIHLQLAANQAFSRDPLFMPADDCRSFPLKSNVLPTKYSLICCPGVRVEPGVVDTPKRHDPNLSLRIPEIGTGGTGRSTDCPDCADL